MTIIDLRTAKNCQSWLYFIFSIVRRHAFSQQYALPIEWCTHWSDESKVHVLMQAARALLLFHCRVYFCSTSHFHETYVNSFFYENDFIMLVSINLHARCDPDYMSQRITMHSVDFDKCFVLYLNDARILNLNYIYILFLCYFTSYSRLSFLLHLYGDLTGFRWSATPV